MRKISPFAFAFAFVSAVAVVCLASDAAPASAAGRGHNGRIAFSAVPKHHRFASEAIFTAGPSGGGVRQLTGGHAAGPTQATRPEFSPDGSHIAFFADGYLRIMRADGSHSHRVIKLAARRGISLDGPATWSPRGRTVALTGYSFDPADPATNATDTAIYLVRSDGSQLRRVRAGSNPVWAPNGRTIAYRSVRCGAIKLMTPSGGHVRSLVRGRCGPSGGSLVDDFSPDSQTLIFSRINSFVTSTAPTSDLFTVNVARRTVHQITHTPRYAEEDARWSPDGTRLAFARRARTPDRPKVFGTFVSTTSGKVLYRFQRYALRVSWQPRR